MRTARHDDSAGPDGRLPRRRESQVTRPATDGAAAARVVVKPRNGRPERGQSDAVTAAVDTSQPTPTVRIGQRDRIPAALTAAIAMFLVVAIAKPWVETAIAPPPFAAASPAPTTTPAPTADPLATLREHCQEPLGWRVYSREAWTGQVVRTWRSVEPAAAAAGPLDSAIPVVPLGPSVAALGYCSPWTGVERVPDRATIEAWRLEPTARGGDGFSAVPLRRVAPDRATPLGGLFDALVDPDDPAAPGEVGWPAGRYVFAIRAPGWDRWWAVEIASPDARADGAASSATPRTTAPP